ITVLPPAAEDLQVFHAGSTLKDGQPVTSGGRVLCVTALGESVRLAQQRALDAVRGIHFDGAQWRNDIGHRAIHAPPRSASGAPPQGGAAGGPAKPDPRRPLGAGDPQ
ncbi:MAG: phosphoribosylglycinamide synthetase C domain-containing protein, partial [Rubrivivax sp.]